MAGARARFSRLLQQGLIVHSAAIQERNGARDVLKSIRRRWPWLRHVFADGGYAGEKLRGALDKVGDWTVETVKRSNTAKGFEVLPRRWVVERTFAWLGRWVVSSIFRTFAQATTAP